MQIGQQVIAKKDGKIVKCYVLEKQEDKIILSDETGEFSRKYWEVQVIKE